MMVARSQCIRDVTACDLMTHPVLTIPQEMPLREAAGVLLRNQYRGAPVVDAQGRCIGTLSSTVFMRIASQREDASATSPPRPLNRPPLSPSTGPDGSQVIGPTLPPGVSPIQIEEPRPAVEAESAAAAPSNGFCTDWQVVDVEKLPAEEVRLYMTAHPVTVLPHASRDRGGRRAWNVVQVFQLDALFPRKPGVVLNKAIRDRPTNADTGHGNDTTADGLPQTYPADRSTSEENERRYGLELDGV